jgi:hypothetical protein
MARRGRPLGLTEARIDKRYIIAGAIIAGLNIAAVARHLGVSRSWASREANAPGTRILIADLFELCRERVKALFDQTLDVSRRCDERAPVLSGESCRCRRRARSLRPARSGEGVYCVDASREQGDAVDPAPAASA